MSAKPPRTRPTPGDPGSRLAANVEPLLTAPAQAPAVVSTPASTEPEAPASTPPAASTEPAASVTPAATEAPAAVAEEAEQPVEPAPAAKRSAARKAATKPKDAVPAEEPRSKRAREEQFSTRVDEEVLAQARAVVMFTAPYGGPRSLAELVETAMRRENQRLADEFNEGEPYKNFTGKFRTGRPLGS